MERAKFLMESKNAFALVAIQEPTAKIVWILKFYLAKYYKSFNFIFQKATCSALFRA